MPLYTVRRWPIAICGPNRRFGLFAPGSIRDHSLFPTTSYGQDVDQLKQVLIARITGPVEDEHGFLGIVAAPEAHEAIQAWLPFHYDVMSALAFLIDTIDTRAETWQDFTAMDQLHHLHELALDSHGRQPLIPVVNEDVVWEVTRDSTGVRRYARKVLSNISAPLAALLACLQAEQPSLAAVDRVGMEPMY